MPQEYVAYKKWFLCYLDFCKKYNHPCVEPNSLSLFCDKLKEKRQNDAQRIQAQLAVKRYYSGLSQETSAPYCLHKVKQIRMETKGSTTGEEKLGPPWDIATNCHEADLAFGPGLPHKINNFDET